MEKVASDFVEAYGSFSPGIDSTDIAVLIANLEGITDTACDELNEDDSIVGVGISTVAALAGYCTGATIGVSSYFSLAHY